MVTGRDHEEERRVKEERTEVSISLMDQERMRE